jgi:hypothetical protein
VVGLVENNAVLEELKALRRDVARLEAERDCNAVLSRYGYYSDHGRRDEWVALWTEDGVFDHMAYYGDDILQPEPALWRRAAITGHKELHDLIYGPANASIVGRSHHVAAAGANSFRLVDDDTAVMATYSIVFVKQNPDAADARLATPPLVSSSRNSEPLTTRITAQNATRAGPRDESNAAG